jgi:hypothetical protein
LEAKELKSYHENIRNLGMGGVRVANEHEAMALAWNPAYLGYNSGLNLTFFDAGLGLNGLQAANTYSSANLNGGLSSFNGLYGKPLWVGAYGIAALSFGNFGGYFSRGYDLSLMFKDPGLPTLDVSYFEDDFYIVGYGHKFSSGFSIGANIKRVVRKGGSRVIPTADLLDPAFTSNLKDNLVSRFTAQGNGVGFDIGVAYQLPTPLNPTFGLSWQDVGYTSFRSNDVNYPIPSLRENLILSATFQQDLTLVGIAGGLEYRHIRNDEEQLGKKIHLGTELSFLFFDFRVGLYQGYPSYGLGMSLWLMQLDLVSYSIEQGVYPGQTPQERIQLALNMSLSFDPDFNLINLKGQKRKLKRRR